VKLPKAITHEQRLRKCNALLDTFMAQASCLGEKLGCLLVQLPPSLMPLSRKRRDAVPRHELRQRHAGAVALEPRHASWFTSAADSLLQAGMKVTRASWPTQCCSTQGSRPGGHSGLVYVRLHGSPNMYYSAYAPDVLDALAVRLRARGGV
jgi:uncharacterized protein YecE (DUF72 family)